MPVIARPRCGRDRRGPGRRPPRVADAGERRRRCAARSAARTVMPLLAIRRASRRRASSSGSERTARAWPSVMSPRASIQSTSSGSSSSRSRFETADFDRPTRSATSPSESSNSSTSDAYARASSTGDSCSRATFSTRPRSSASLVARRRGRAPGSVATPADARGSPAPLACDQLEAALGLRRTTIG